MVFPWDQSRLRLSKSRDLGPADMLVAMKFSGRTAWEPGVNEWAAAVEAAADTQSLIDLTVSNPTTCGLGLRPSTILAPLASPEALHYTPDPLGMTAARRAVADYYRDHGVDVARSRICLTTGTSEAYSFLFRLLCNPGDEILIARPSYPLFALLAQLHDVSLREYTLLHEAGGVTGADSRWCLDLPALELSITPRTRAILVVHPNNPTGHYVAAAEREALVALCAARDLALLVDEVFLDYAIDAPAALAGTFATESGCACFVLSGLSKICALPQMKAAWIVASGPEAEVGEAMRRLEIIADTFLSMNAPIQHALPAWLHRREEAQGPLRERLRRNLDVLDHRLRGSLGDRHGVEGGWTAVLRVPRFVAGEPFPLAALRAGAVVQPGSLYGLPDGRCVVSLLTEPAVLRAGMERLPL